VSRELIALSTQTAMLVPGQKLEDYITTNMSRAIPHKLLGYRKLFKHSLIEEISFWDIPLSNQGYISRMNNTYFGTLGSAI
jgi:hypothetical protein